MDLLAMTSADRALSSIIDEGLPPTRRRAHVIVVGAGMAGLVAGHELVRGGHEVTLLEARLRVGGRIRTVRDGFADGLAAEMGAMRIPTSHGLTGAYLERFGLPVAPFHSHSESAYTFIRGRRRRADELVDDEFELRADERGLGLEGLLSRSLAPLQGLIARDGDRGWAEVTRQWDDCSLRDFLVGSGWSPGAVEMFGILARHESLMDSAFLEFFRGSNHADSPMVRVVGGMDLLPRAFLASLRDRVRYGASVRALEQGPGFVRVHYETTGGRRTVTGDYAIVTLPYSVMRHVDFVPSLSPDKQRAVRQIHYDTATKIVMQFRRRFWEDEGIPYGSSVTDLPIRNVVYTENDGPAAGERGLMIASYTWSQDAHRWGALSEAERLRQALADLTRIHPRAPEFYEGGQSHAWASDPFSAGAYTVFQPGQQSRLHDAICGPEGRIHFAGEHTSLLHRWVEGAVESGLRVALEISLAAQQRALLGEAAAPELADPCEGCLAVSFHAGVEAIRAGDPGALASIVSAEPDLVVADHPAPLDVAGRPMAGATLLHLAVVAGEESVSLVQALADGGADVDAVGEVAGERGGPLSVLAAAVELGTASIDEREAVVALLLTSGADPDSGTGRPLHSALVRSSHAEPAARLAAAIRRAGAGTDAATAAALGEAATVRALVTAGPGSLAQRYRPESDRLDSSDVARLLAEALVFACRGRQRELAELLLEAGADPAERVSVLGIRRTAVHEAAEMDDVEIVSLLLARGGRLDVGDSEWASSPYAWAYHAQALRVLNHLSAEAALSPEDVVYRGTVDEVATVLAGRSPDDAHTLGANGVVLRNAAVAGRRDVCELLVAAGADPALPSPLGVRPADLARQRGHTALAEWLESVAVG